MNFFTPEQANRALDTVRPLTERLVASRREFVRLHEKLQEVRAKVAGNGGGLDAEAVNKAQAAADRALADVDDVLRELEGIGAQVKDLDRGLIDFPARHPSGETVLLCWELGEDDVRHWHGLEDGYAGRKALPF